MRGYAPASRATSTQRLYAANWQRFQTWSASRGELPTITSQLAAIDGTIAEVMVGIRRSWAFRPEIAGGNDRSERDHLRVA